MEALQVALERWQYQIKLLEAVEDQDKLIRKLWVQCKCSTRWNGNSYLFSFLQGFIYSTRRPWRALTLCDLEFEVSINNHNSKRVVEQNLNSPGKGTARLCRLGCRDVLDHHWKFSKTVTGSQSGQLSQVGKWGQGPSQRRGSWPCERNIEGEKVL